MSVLDTLAPLALVGAAGLVAYEVVRNRGQGNPFAQAGQDAGTAAGSAGVGAVTGVVNAVGAGPGAPDLCQLIQLWRQNGSPTVNLINMFGLTLPIGGGDPTSWANFTAYAERSAWIIPPDQPPSCW